VGRTQAQLDLVAEVGCRASGPRVERVDQNGSGNLNGLDEKKPEILPHYYSG
jgi:hypothetical protein